MRNKFLLLLLMSFLFGNCNRKTYEEGASYGVDPDFVATTTPFDVTKEKFEDLCVFENNNVRAYSDSVPPLQHAWSVVAEDGSKISLGNKSTQLLTHGGKYMYNRKGVYKGVSYDTTVTFVWNYCLAYIDFPDVFEPNGNGSFDFWGPLGEGVKSIDFTVFDRNDKVVFTGNSMTDKWYGLINGSNAPLGTYEFQAKGSLKSGYMFEYNGLFELIR